MMTGSSQNKNQTLKTVMFRDYIKALCDAIDAEKTLSDNKKSSFFCSLLNINSIIMADECLPTSPLMQMFDKKFLNQFEDCKKALLKIAHVYYDKKTQKDSFPEYNTHAIQTCIRELLHEYLNPVPELALDHVKNLISTYRKAIGDKNSNPLNLSFDSITRIHSYLNHASSKALASSCKFFYSFHNEFHKVNILYSVGNPIHRSLKWNESTLNSAHLYDLKEVNEEVIGNSMKNIKTTVPLFTSLYQAIEFAHYQTLEIPRAPVFSDHLLPAIPSIWAVFYPNAKNCEFVPEDITLNEGWIRDYAGTERKIAFFYEEVERNSIIPLVGTILYSPSNFADYRKFPVVNYQNYLQALSDKPCCRVM